MKTKKNIIHLIQSLNTGGTEHVLLKTLPLLSQEFEHQIITLKEPGELAEKFARKGIKVMNLGSRGLLDLANGQKLFRFVNAQKPALIITHMFHADVAGRLLLQKRNAAPVISSLVTTYNFPRYWPARLFEKLTRQWTKHYLANSEAVKDYYVANIGVAPSKITVIHNGIDVSIYNRATGEAVVQELKLPPKRTVISCVANLAVNKGHTYLLEAFEAVFQNFPQAFLLIIGEGQERANLEQQIEGYKSKSHVKFLGRRSDVPELLAITDVFVLPTLFEGLSNAILEAMAAKCAVITTDIPENRVMIKNHETGLLVPTQNAKAITEALIMLLKDEKKRQQLGQNAHAFIKANFDLQHIARELDQAVRRYART